MNEGDVFKDVAILLESISGSLKIRTENLKPVYEPVDSNDLHAKDTIALFLIRILNRYNRTLLHVSKCIATEDSELHYFTLPHIRTIIDIYAKILHLAVCEDDDLRALKCIGYQANSASKISGGFLQNLIIFNKSFLEEHRVTIPENEAEVWSWYKKSDYKFPGNNIILDPEVMSKYAVQTEEVFKAKDWYTIYSHISEIVHGNPYYHDKPHNERLWISTMSMSTTAYTLELIDRFFLDKVNPRDYREWLRLAKDIQPRITKQWLNRSRSDQTLFD